MTKTFLFDDLFTIRANMRSWSFQKKLARGAKLQANAQNKEQGEAGKTHIRPRS